MNITQMLLTPNKWSRPQKKVNKIKGVVIHWVANPKSTAVANRNFFENRKLGKTNFGSAHFIVGLKGEIIQCLPYDEMAYHVGSTEPYASAALSRLSSYPNDCTIGIEMCHPDATGKPTLETFHATVELAAFLLKKYGLTYKDLWLHKEVVNWKDCHKYYVDNPLEWNNFKLSVNEEMNPPIVKVPTNEGGSKVSITKSQETIGTAAIKTLVAEGLIDSPDYWLPRLGESTQNWLFFEMMRRLNARIEDVKKGK
jgi:N-acetylmuramoyl-L-alanine amidase CwlA